MTAASARRAAALEAARAGGAVAAESYRETLDVTTKAGKTDVVTDADHAAQERVIEVVRKSFPGDPIVGEEAGIPDGLPESGPAWVVDPIDGTNNFVRGVPLWVTSVAATVDGEPVAAATVAPALAEEFVAGPDAASRNDEPMTVSAVRDPETWFVAPVLGWPRRSRTRYASLLGTLVDRVGDIRRFGSAQYTLSLVASGGLDAAVSDRRAPAWDTVAGVHQIRNAGGTVTDVHGEPWRHDSDGLVASNGTDHAALLAAMDEVA